ncbi:hypothetical protein [Algoriphagus jejuensis]|uniref:hypothetical protein n=1 Tax=Algoriphagus jejuensis TaxID=419934 RepID=UPI0031D7B451
MELKLPQTLHLGFPAGILNKFFCKELSKSFDPSLPNSSFCPETDRSQLYTIDIFEILDCLQSPDLQQQLDRGGCDIPVLLFGPDFSASRLLFHYDGSSNSADLIRNFISLFGNLIQESKATIISPSFIPKSKIREEQEIIQLVATSVKETSFIKFNFTGIGDFWSYGEKHNCSILVTSKLYQADLVEIFLQTYKGKEWSHPLSFYLSL